MNKKTIQYIKDHLSGNTDDRDMWECQVDLFVKGTSVEKECLSEICLSVDDKGELEYGIENLLQELFKNAMKMAINVIESFEK